MNHRRLSEMDLGAEDDLSLAKHPDDLADDQRLDAEVAIERPSYNFLHLPWSGLDEVVGGIAPGDVWFIGAYSGHGKTTFLMSALDAWFLQDKRIFYMGLESQPSVLRTQWACQRLGLSAGDVLSGALHNTEGWKFTRARLKDELAWQTKDGRAEQVYFSPEKFVTAEKLRSAAKQASELQSDVLIIDHVDHLEGTKGGLYENSVQSMKTLLSLAQELGLKVLAATQFNNEMLKGSRVGVHQAPSATAVYMGSHKRMVASGMLGLYKPLRFDITADQLRDFRDGKIESPQIIEPGVMGVSVMKHRLYGPREGRRVFLRVENGKVTDLPSADLHGPTTRDGFRRNDL